MSATDDADYHAQRARRELDLALTAKANDAGRAHLELASLHMARARQLSPGRIEPQLRM